MRTHIAAATRTLFSQTSRALSRPALRFSPQFGAVVASSMAGFFMFTSVALAEPPSGPRNPSVFGPYIRNMLVPPPASPAVRLIEYIDRGMTAFTADTSLPKDPFLDDFGNMSSAKNHCCGRGDCRYVGEATPTTDGGFIVDVPADTYRLERKNRQTELSN